jgi:hypothetical protein
MPDPFVALAFFSLGWAILGLGMYIGTNKANQRWRAWLRSQVR